MMSNKDTQLFRSVSLKKSSSSLNPFGKISSLHVLYFNVVSSFKFKYTMGGLGDMFLIKNIVTFIINGMRCFSENFHSIENDEMDV